MADGIIKVCPVCEKVFWIPIPEEWAYKRTATVDSGDREMLYFNKYSCKRKYDAEYEIKMSKKRVATMKREHQKRKAQKFGVLRVGDEVEADTDKHCIDCYYCEKSKYGFYDCVARQYALNPYKVACKKFVPKNGG